MVIGILEPHLNGVMIHITYRKLISNLIKPERLELKVCHCTCGILCESLIHADIYGGTCIEVSSYKMRFQYLICDSKAGRVAELLDGILRSEPYPVWVIFVGAVLAAGSFAIFFGGNIFDGIAAGILGLVITAIDYYRPSSFNRMARSVICSFVAGVLSYVLVNAGIGQNIDMIIIGSVMLLVPGLTFGNALRDLLCGDVISGSIEVVSSMLSAAMIAFGYSAAILLMSM